MSVYGYLLFQQESLPLKNKITVIGRAPSCHIVFSHPSISKEHGVIQFGEDGVAVLKDLSSLNGIYVNDELVPKGGQIRLPNNASIIFAKDPIKYTFFSQAESGKAKNTSPIVETRKSAQGIRQPYDLDARVNLVDKSFEKIDSMYNPMQSHTSSFGAGPSENVNRRLPFAQSASKVPLEQNKASNVIPPLWQTGPVQQHLQKSSSHKQLQPEKLTSTQVQTQGQSPTLDKKTNLVHHNEILELNERVLQKEEAVFKKENEINLYKSEIDSLRDECGKLRSKLHAVELYASELQRKNDLLTHEISERNIIIQEFQSSDLGLKSQASMNEGKSLRQILMAKDEELNSLKRQLKAVLQAQTDPRTNTNHYEGFLEQQAKELSTAKRQLQEFEIRAEECKRKWTQLIKENINKEEKIKGLNFQLNRQIESYQTLYADSDRKIAIINAKFISLINDDRESSERQAAEFLVEQMREIQEERERIALENEQMHLQIQELIEETKRLHGEIQELHQFFDPERPGIDQQPSGPNLSKMRGRIEELEDLLHETRQADGARKVAELNETISQLEKKLALQERTNQDLRDKISDVKANQGAVHDQNAIDFFSKLLEEKDQQIQYLRNQNDTFIAKEKQYQIEIETLRENVKQSTLQFENYKARQSRLENVLTNKAGLPVSIPGLSSDLRLTPNKQLGLLSDIRFSQEAPYENIE